MTADTQREEVIRHEAMKAGFEMGQTIDQIRNESRIGGLVIVIIMLVLMLLTVLGLT